MGAIAAVAAVLIGLALGPLENVLIRRVPNRGPLGPLGPRCPKCNAQIPIVSWLTTRGRCSQCGEARPARDLLVELFSAGLLLAATLRFGWSWALPPFCVFFVSLLVIAVIDLDHLIVPNRVLYPTLFVTAPLLVVAAAATGGWSHVGRAAIGGFAGFVALLVVHLVTPAGMGFGDVRLAGLIGMMLGWLGLGYVLLGFFVSFLLASVVGIGLIVTRLRSRKDPVPFGPFLAAGAVVAVVWGQPILHFYGHGGA